MGLRNVHRRYSCGLSTCYITCVCVSDGTLWVCNRGRRRGRDHGVRAVLAAPLIPPGPTREQLFVSVPFISALIPISAVAHQSLGAAAPEHAVPELRGAARLQQPRRELGRERSHRYAQTTAFGKMVLTQFSSCFLKRKPLRVRTILCVSDYTRPGLAP